MTKKIRQAYRQTPWRRQLRSLGFSMLPVIALLVITALHLVISAQAAEAGLQIMEMHYEEEEILRQIANQRTQLAWITSYGEMTKRAKKLGFEPVQTDFIHFMIIPGYMGREAVLLAPPPNQENRSTPLVNESYQKSLWDWFVETFLTSKKEGENFG